MNTTSERLCRDRASEELGDEILVVGLGSPHGDDQFGWAVVERLRGRLPAGATALAVNGGLDLLARLDGQFAVIVVDAAAPAGRPGRASTFEWPCPGLAECRPLSTHGPGLVEALRLAEVLGRLPRHVLIHAVEAESVQPGAALGAIAAERVGPLVAAILDDLANVSAERDCRGGVGDA